MSIRDAFENCLVELNKVQAPSLLLDDFVYLFNKAVQQYINIRYNLFETKQQLTDDLRVLLVTHIHGLGTPEKGSFDGYTMDLPVDYQHMLNCICTFSQGNAKCDKNRTIIRGANKMDTTQWPHVIDNYYMKPSVKQPYYYIMNIQDPIVDTTLRHTDEDKDDYAASAVNPYARYGNSSVPKMQIKYGEDPRYELTEVRIDYLRAPYYYTLTQDQLDDWTDNSMIIEFPDYVVYEIINTLVKIILENGSNPRMQSHVAANTSIA